MAIAKKFLNGVGKTLFVPNPPSTGGLSAFAVPWKLSGAGVAVALGGATGIGLLNQGVQTRNRVNLGKVSYSTPARMTGSFDSGVVQAMRRASGGNYNAFSDMAEEVVSSPGIIPKIEDYGATPELISALYHMGGR